MSLLVLKFGGTSVANIERIRNVASIVKKEVEAGHKVAVVVSAMSGVTNQLDGWVRELTPLLSDEAMAEYDSVVCSGEQVTSGLTALALQEIGVKARSWVGAQLPVKSDTTYTKARIEEIDTKPLFECLNNNIVVVIPGFQGLNDEGRLTTLGRGGSDTSAVALAAALKSDRCDIYTDVDGVYTTDPRVVPKARKLNKIAFEEVFEMASQGSKVLQVRSVEMAMKYNVPVQVRSAFEDVPGTMVVNEEEVMERRLITGIAFSRNEAQVTLIGVKNQPGVAATVFGPLAEAEINVDMIVQNISEGGNETEITFTVSKTDLKKAVTALESVKSSGKLPFKKIITNEAVAKISVIGVGMRTHSGLAHTMFKVLAEKGINIHVISTSEIKISVLVDDEYLELACRALHTAYGLDSKE